jgi:hypothetical protein
MTKMKYILLSEKDVTIIAELPMKITLGEMFYCAYGKFKVLEHTENFIIATRIYSEYQLRKFSDDKRKIFDIINKSVVGNEMWQDFIHEMSADLYNLTNK